MTKLKRAFIVGATILAIGVTSITAFAMTNPTNPTTDVTQATQTVDATQATDARVCTPERKAERLQEKKELLAERVKDKTLTQEKADEIVAALEANQANCDGTGSAKIGQKFGAGFGHGNGRGTGQGKGACDGSGQGHRRGNGQGKGQCNGTGQGE